MDHQNPTPTPTEQGATPTPATPAAQPAPPKTFTQEELNGIVQQRLADDRARRGAVAQAAPPAAAPPSGGDGGKPKPDAPLTEDAVMALMARERVFTHATKDFQIQPGALTRMEAAFRAEKPADPAAWTQSYIADMGFSKVTMQQPTTPAPAATPASPAPMPPAAAPSAPTPHTLPTNLGLIDLWNLKPEQIDQLGPAGIKAEFEKHKEVGNRLMGAPQRPKLPQQR